MQSTVSIMQGSGHWQKQSVNNTYIRATWLYTEYNVDYAKKCRVKYIIYRVYTLNRYLGNIQSTVLTMQSSVEWII